MGRSDMSPPPGGPRTPAHIRATIAQPRFRVALIGLGVLVVLAVAAWFVVPYDSQHDRVTVWFWTSLGIGTVELVFIAVFDLLGDFLPLPDLVTDLATPWPPPAHAFLVPLLLIAGMVVDHIWVH